MTSTIRSYILKCQDKGNNAETINTKLVRIRAFFNNMVNAEQLKPVQPKLLKEDVKVEVFSDEQINQC